MARVTIQRKTKTTAARTTISMGLLSCSRQQPGAERDLGDGPAVVGDQADGPGPALLAGGLDVGVVGEDERVAAGGVEREEEGVPVAHRGGRVRGEALGLEDVEVVA